MQFISIFKLKWMAAAFSLLYGSSVFADCTSDRCSNVDVTRLYPTNSGAVYIATSGDETILNCTPYGGTQVTLRDEHKNKDIIYSTLLAAQLSSKKVMIRIVEGSANCEVAYITINQQ